MKNISNTLLFFIFLILLGCNDNNKDADASLSNNADQITLSEDQVRSANIQLGKIEKRTLRNLLQANGVLDVPPQNMITISAPLGGFVKDTHLLQGMAVKKGEALIEMEDVQYIDIQEQYLDLVSQLEYARAEYTRQQELATENVNATKTVQLTKANFESLNSKVEALKAKLAIININAESLENGKIHRTIKLYSPIKGYVTEVNVNLGEHVNPTDVLVKIIDTEHLHVELYVYEQDISQLHIGQKINFSLVNEDMVRTAHVHLINREITSDRTVRVHCHLDKEDTDLLPGMYVHAYIETSASESDTLPEEAIVTFEGNSYIFTTNDSKTFNMVKVLAGATDNGYTEITFPQERSDQDIIIKGSYALLSLLKNTEEE